MKEIDDQGEVIPHYVIEQIRKSEKEFEEGNWFTLEEVMHEFQKYLE